MIYCSALVVALANFCWAAMAADDPLRSQMPAEQKHICSISDSYTARGLEFNKLNAVQQARLGGTPYSAGVQAKFQQQIVDVIGTTGKFSNWVGRLGWSATSQGVFVEFGFACSDSPFTSPFSFVALIPLNNSLADAVAKLPNGNPGGGQYLNTNAPVKITGHLNYLAHPKNCRNDKPGFDSWSQDSLFRTGCAVSDYGVFTSVLTSIQPLKAPNP